jgi:hypothetical protein
MGSPIILNAQEVRASIIGTVTDPSGAAISGASVRATNLATNISVTTTTNETGSYLTPFLAPGSYQLTAEMKGFKKYVHDGIVLQALDKPRVDIQLQVGQLADSVTVNETVSTLQTETASRAQTISTEMIANIPTQGRNPFQLAWEVPSVVKTGTFRYLRSFDTGGTAGLAINGGRTKENEVLLDGISTARADRSAGHVPMMESLAEFKVLTNTYDAQYGRTGGGTITMISKGGGNQLHGTAFEYFQNDKLNGNQWELNAAGTKRPPNHINTYGFQASGPVVLPKIFDGRNKLFWTLSYEAMRQRSADPGKTTLPLAEWRTGDFSGLYTSNKDALTPITIYDPLTTTSAGARTPFTGNIIPSSRINKIATNVLSYVPLPTSYGDNPSHVNNFVYPSRWIGDLNQWSGRMDFQVNSKNNVYVRYGQNPYSEYRGLVFTRNPSDANPAEPTGNAPLLRNGRTWMADWTSTLSSTMVFNLRAGLSRWEEGSGSTFGAGFDPAKLGFDSNLTKQFQQYQFPRFEFDNYQAMGSGTLANLGAYDTYTLQPNVSLVKSRHVMKFGAELRRYNNNTQQPGKASGYYKFTKDWTQQYAASSSSVAGDDFASFMLGYPGSADITKNPPYVDKNIDPSYRNYFYAGFFQDDWKVTPKLTLNFGLRWDYESPWVERWDRMIDAFDTSATSPLASSVTGLSLKGKVLFANTGNQARGVVNPDRNNFAPRVGMSYQLSDKWVVRGGYGLFFLGQSASGSNAGFSQQTKGVATNDSLTPAVTITNAFLGVNNGTLIAAKGVNSDLYGTSVSGVMQDRPLPYSHQYSIDIQRELPYGILFEMGYSGNITKKLPIDASLNYIPKASLGQASSVYTTKVANPMAGLIPNNSSLNAATISTANLMYAFPQYSGLSITNIPMGSSRYDAAIFKATKRMSNGLTFIASFTASKNLEQVNLINPQDLNTSDYLASAIEKRSAKEADTPRKFTFAGVYELPFGRGRKLGTDMPKVLDYVVGGWSTNWDYSFFKGWAIQYPNSVQYTAGSAKLDNPTKAKWFNTDLWKNPATSAFSSKGQYQYQNFPTYFSDIRTPSNNNLNLSVAKFFPIKERLKIQLRGEFVNALNRPWFAEISSVDVTNKAFGMLKTTESNLPRYVKIATVVTW